MAFGFICQGYARGVQALEPECGVGSKPPRAGGSAGFRMQKVALREWLPMAEWLRREGGRAERTRRASLEPGGSPL